MTGDCPQWAWLVTRVQAQVEITAHVQASSREVIAEARRIRAAAQAARGAAAEAPLVRESHDFLDRAAEAVEAATP